MKARKHIFFESGMTFHSFFIAVFSILVMFKLLEKNIKNTVEKSEYQIDHEIETAFLEDKSDYGRIRNSLSHYFRETYGDEIVNRVLQRLDKRKNHQLCFTKLTNGQKIQQEPSL